MPVDPSSLQKVAVPKSEEVAAPAAANLLRIDEEATLNNLAIILSP